MDKKRKNNKYMIVHAIGDNVVNRFDNSIGVTLRFSDRCNYKCEYCNYHDNSLPFYSYSHSIKLVDNLMESLKTKNKIFVYIHGGEPTIIPKFKEIIDYILTFNNVHDIIIQTNCSKDKEYFNQFIGYEKVSFAISYQHHMNRNKEFLLYQEKAEFLIENNLLYHINFSLENMYIDEIVNIIKHLHKVHDFDGKIIYNYIDVHPKEYIEIHNIINAVYFDDKEYAMKITFDDDSVKQYDDYNALRKDGYNKYKRYTCTAGNKNLVIQPNGDIYYCLSHEATGKPIGNLITDNTVEKIISRKMIICNFDDCSCELWLEKCNLSYLRR